MPMQLASPALFPLESWEIHRDEAIAEKGALDMRSIQADAGLRPATTFLEPDQLREAEALFRRLGGDMSNDNIGTTWYRKCIIVLLGFGLQTLRHIDSQLGQGVQSADL